MCSFSFNGDPSLSFPEQEENMCIMPLESFGTKHEIAQVTDHLEAQVKIANLRQKHKK